MSTDGKLLRARIEAEIRRQSDMLEGAQPGGTAWRAARSTMATLAEIRGHLPGDCYVYRGRACPGVKGKACRHCGQIVRVG